MEIMGTTNGAKPIKCDFMRCPRNRCDGNNENANFVLQQIIFPDSFVRLARAANDGDYISFYSRACTFTLLSLLMYNFDSWYLMSNANHLCDNEYNETTIENGFAQQRINICFVNREPRVAEFVSPKRMQYKIDQIQIPFSLPPSPPPPLLSSPATPSLRFKGEYFTSFWIGITASRHTMESCQSINSMPLSLSSTYLSKDKVTATATANERKTRNETKWNRQSTERTGTHVSGTVPNAGKMFERRRKKK